MFIHRRPPNINVKVLPHLSFVSLSGALDLTTPSDRALGGILAVFADTERDILRERVRAGTRRRERKESPTAGRHPPRARSCGSGLLPVSGLPGFSAIIGERRESLQIVNCNAVYFLALRIHTG